MLTDTFKNVTPYEHNLKGYTEVIWGIIEFIAKDIMPISIVTKPGFIALIDTINKWYRISSHTHILLRLVYLSCKKMQTESGSEAVGFYVTMTSVWSSRTVES